MMADRGISVTHTTIILLVQRYVPESEKLLAPRSARGRIAVFQPRTALLAGTRSFSLRENGVYRYADLEF
jgi:hypothetical protein